MSFQEEKRESIKKYMLEKIRQDDEQFIQKTMENFQISITTVKRYLRECLENQILCISLRLRMLNLDSLLFLAMS